MSELSNEFYIDKSKEHRERLEFLVDYLNTTHEAHAFSRDQRLVRKRAELERYREWGDQSEWEYEHAEEQLVSLNMYELINAQAVILIWSFVEILFEGYINVVTKDPKAFATFIRSQAQQNRRRTPSKVKLWEEYFKNLAVTTKPNITNENWNFLQSALHIRNYIAHNLHNSGTKPTGKQLEAANNLDGIDLTAEGIRVDHMFLQAFIDRAAGLLKALEGDHWKTRLTLKTKRSKVHLISPLN